MVKKSYINANLFILLVIAGITHPACAEIYKWVDESGRVHYGDKPGNEDSLKLDIKENHTVSDIDTMRESRRQRILDVMTEERQHRQRQLAESRQQEKERKIRCDQARENLSSIKNSSYLLEQTDDPYNPKILTETERHSATLEAEKVVDHWCKD